MIPIRTAVSRRAGDRYKEIRCAAGPLEWVSERVRVLVNHTSLKFVLLFWMILVLPCLCPNIRAEERMPTPRLATPPQRPTLPPYVQRGNAVEARYIAYAERVGVFHEALRAALREEAPGLVEQLSKEPPQPVAYGYQIIPRLVRDGPRPKKLPRFSRISYSWPRTEKLLGGELAELLYHFRHQMNVLFWSLWFPACKYA